jgi:hypothetical protein
VTRSTDRPAAAWLAGAVVGAGLLLSGCSAGQIAETARKDPSIQGVNADAQLVEGGQVVGSVGVRDVLVAYPGPEGYERGGDAPLEVRIFNETPEAVTVQVQAAQPADGANGMIRASSVVLVGDAAATTPAAEPTGSASPGAGGSAPADGAAPSIEIPPGELFILTREAGSYLRLDGLGDRLLAGMSVPLRFQFSNGLQLAVSAPVANPLSPIPRAPAEEEAEEGH